MISFPRDSDTCPVTGLPITRKPTWVDVPLTAHYTATFALIGDHILFSAPQGDAGSDGMPRFLELRERVLHEVGLWQEPHVEVKCYDHLKPLHSSTSRSLFTAGMLAEVHRGFLRGFWAFGGHPAIQWILRIGTYRAIGPTPPIPFDFVHDYREAILAAMTEIERLEITKPDWTMSDERGWTIDTREASGRYRLIAPDVIHCEVHGDIDIDFVSRDVDLLERICHEVALPPNQPFFQIRDMRHTSVPGSQERQLIVKKMTRLARLRAYGGTVIFGIPRLSLRLLVNAVKGPMPGRLLQVATYPEALATIDHLRETYRSRGFGARLRHFIPKLYSRRQIDRQVDELLAYTSAISWNEEAPQASLPTALTQDNLLRPIQAAISVLKLDFDRLLQQNAATQTQLLHAAKLASLGTLTSGLAHELNSPLAAVSGYAQRLARSDDPKVRDEAAAILRAAGRMRAIIGQLGPGASRPSGPRRPFDLGASIEDDVLPLLGPLLEKKKISLDITRPEIPVVFHGNPTEIQGALVNVLTNACHALATLPDDAPRRINLILRKTSNDIEIICHDTGPGMSEEVRQRAIDPFFTTKNVGEGSGLGLYLAHRFIEDHGGILQLAETNRGCRVVIRLPSADTSTDVTHLTL